MDGRPELEALRERGANLHRGRRVQGRFGEEVRAQQPVLDEWKVHVSVYGVAKVCGRRHQKLELGSSGLALGAMHVYFVAVEVAVVGRRRGEVESKGAVGKHFYPVGHHASFVKRGLAIDGDEISRSQRPLHHVPDRKGEARRESEIEHLALALHHEVVADALAQFLQAGQVQIVHRLLDANGPRHAFRDADLVNGERVVSRHHCSRAHLASLSLYVLSQPASFLSILPRMVVSLCAAPL